MTDKNHIIELLSALNLNDLNRLVSTTTQYLNKVEYGDKKEAIQIIILNSSDTRLLLKRKLITREILFNYLNSKQIPPSEPHTKESLIEDVLNYWNSLTKTIAVKDITLEKTQCGNPTEEELQTVNRNGNSSQEGRSISSSTNINELALKFSEWFYKMFNENKPIDVEHFWEDCKFKLNLKNGNVTISTEMVDCAVETTNLFFKTKKEHGIYLNPNLLPEGVQGRIDNHGLVLVLVCGTIHKNNLCVGLFEQIFALIKDPMMTNNWRIKYSELNLKHLSNTSQIPRLTDSELTSPLLQLPES